MNDTKHQVYLFTDGSVSPQSGIGFGAYLLLEKLNFFYAKEMKIELKKFTDTSSTKLELETLLWALTDVDVTNFKVVIYTDCQNIIGLQVRREKFEKNSYMTAKGKVIKNHELYKEFFKLVDALDCDFIKIKGHKKSSTKNEIDDIFTLVDRATRNTLRDSIL